MVTTKDVANQLGKSTTSVIRYIREYPEFLSPEANPPVGQVRQFSPEDVAVLQTIAILKRQRESADTIREALLVGDRIEPLAEMPQDRADIVPGPEDKPELALAPLDLIERFMTQIEAANTARIDAEKRAASEKTRADMLQLQLDEMKASGEEKRGFWTRLLRR